MSPEGSGLRSGFLHRGLYLLIPLTRSDFKLFAFHLLAMHHVAVSVNPPSVLCPTPPTGPTLSPQNRAGEHKAGVKVGRGDPTQL